MHDRERDHAGQRQRRRPAGRAEPLTLDRAGGAVGDPGVAAVPAQQLGSQQQHAAEHEDAGDHVGRRAVERGAVLVVDRGGERRELQHLQGPELRQQVQGDQRRAAEHGRPQLRQHDRRNARPRVWFSA